MLPYFSSATRRACAGALLGLCAIAGLVEAATPAPIQLTGEVGPGFIITLKKGTTRVTKLKPGRYVITVRDRSTSHNFHLVGPHLTRSTLVAKVMTVTWTVTLTAGTYRYLCDPHASSMRGSFLVAN